MNAVPGEGIRNNFSQPFWIYPPSPEPSTSGWTMKRVSGGITNDLYLVNHDAVKVGCEGEGVLIRLFGAEGMINRDNETSAFACLCEDNVAYKYLGRFGTPPTAGGGRIEGFLKGYAPLEKEDFADPDTSASIALEMCKVHNFTPNDLLKEFFGAESNLFPELATWLRNAKEAVQKSTFKTPEDNERANKLDIDAVGETIEKYKQQLSAFSPPPEIAFCHNDLLAANIMRNKDKAIKLIDFEYGGMNYICFDIANHFNEFAGGTDDSKPDYSLLPDIGQKTKFINTYVDAKVAPDCVKVEREEMVQTLLGQVGVFEELNHCYWGLWGVNQGNSEGTGEFDYLNYAKARFGQLK
ncbi:hypothetical protein TrRE_jg2582 [Triparma retinervis]|uniref:ethanolamine kinase n=1 Tax=Triparma retinervis TaxID=2557542 RepID=A0A9W6ZEJ8_9STRA|nr:hypothetical protein TrRE_jg2582 [Triparma retinervis]